MCRADSVASVSATTFLICIHQFRIQNLVKVTGTVHGLLRFGFQKLPVAGSMRPRSFTDILCWPLSSALHEVDLYGKSLFPSVLFVRPVDLPF